MSKPTAFLYCWTDHRDNRLYVGYHVGEETDGYICSSKLMKSEYINRPNDFTREIIARGNKSDMISLETAILTAENAAVNESYYNKTNGNKKFVCISHSEETKKKQSDSWKAKGIYNCDNKLAVEAWTGSKHTSSAKEKMSIKQKLHSESRRTKMVDSNPMKDPRSIAKMLETRRRNKELRNG